MAECDEEESSEDETESDDDDETENSQDVSIEPEYESGEGMQNQGENISYEEMAENNSVEFDMEEDEEHG